MTDHQEKEHKDSKNKKTRQRLQRFCRSQLQKTPSKQGDGKDNAMAVALGADRKYDNKLNANPVPPAEARGRDFRCGSRKYSPQVEKFGRDRRNRRRTLKSGVVSRVTAQRLTTISLAPRLIDQATPGQTVFSNFFAVWLPLGLQWPHSCLDQCVGCTASQEGSSMNVVGCILTVAKNSASRFSLLPLPSKS